ncbi:LytTR family DNA-binding domain-containing protein [Thalassotalea sp. 1_MG-2023]|uniref:LytR/AlgR family response regulator transcription factor n=1 Tax=Thalassotalea sp. 1_MG-2023 TaxID=3062680 RepID=UPI0026E3BD03|nr:LytTR family DNA-binding domain-containing protein [Thalassotalea sp. 1_MG-2023]MDO6427231.1 LytTR family DNA-binding domain-containing protein [Thalassotalea sp. 1_MG-2023]
MDKLNALIIDDEPLAHDILQSFCDNVPFINVVGQCYSATQALDFLSKQSVDLLFLDINMPMLSGLDLLKVLKEKPQVVITSAYQEYALESFELDVSDYLLKPFSFERFLQACNKSLSHYELVQQATHTDKPNAIKQIFVKVDKKQLKINLADVSCFEAYGNYVKVWRDGQSVLTPRTLSSFVEQLKDTCFLQVHKSAIVNLEHISFIEGNQITLIDEREINIGKSFKAQVLEKVAQIK